MSDPLLKSEIHAERNTGILATGYDSRIQTYITGQGTPFASGYAKNHILRDLNRKLFNHGLSSYITDSYDAGFRPTTLTGILAAGGGGGSVDFGLLQEDGSSFILQEDASSEIQTEDAT